MMTSKIWLTANLPCSILLKGLLPHWLPYYAKTFEPIDPNTLNLIEKISTATIDRLLKPIRPRYNKKGRSCTKPGSLLRHQIPIGINQWNQFIPGFLEADTVHHCDDTTAGQYVITVNYTDLATGWTEQRAVWGKGEQGVLKQTEDVEHSLPFALLGFDSDNGGEFINEHLFKYMTGRKSKPVQFTRSRPYKKDDNAHIEQKTGPMFVNGSGTTVLTTPPWFLCSMNFTNQNGTFITTSSFRPLSSLTKNGNILRS